MRDSGETVTAPSGNDRPGRAIRESGPQLVQAARIGPGQEPIPAKEPRTEDHVVAFAEPAEPAQDESAVEWPRGGYDVDTVAGPELPGDDQRRRPLWLARRESSRRRC